MPETIPRVSLKALPTKPQNISCFIDSILPLQPPVDINSIIQGLDVPVISSAPLEMGDKLPDELADSSIVDTDSMRIDSVLELGEEGARIFMNRDNPPTRQRFTLAAFLYHLLWASPGVYVRTSDGYQSKLKSGSMDFASEFLMPDAWLTQALEGPTPPRTEDLAGLFGVSPGAMNARLRNYYERVFPAAEKPWRELGISPRSSLEEAERAYLDLIHQHRPELFAALPPEYGELATRRRGDILASWAELQLQHALRLPGGIPFVETVPPLTEIAAVLKAARSLIATRGWGQNVRARDGYGKKQVRFDNERAGQFSVVGAVLRAAASRSGVGDIHIAFIAKAAACPAHPESLQAWNDAPERTRAEVLGTIDAALLFAEPKPPSP